MNINTCYPAKIVEFDPTTQTATVELQIEQYFKNIDSKGYEEIENVEIHKVPVQFPYGSGYTITMPVKTGDYCLVHFAQNGFEHWLFEDKDKTGLIRGKPSPQHRRRYNINDALCVVGFNPESVGEANAHNPDFLEIKNPNHDVVIQLTEDSLNINVAKDITLNVGGNAIIDVAGETTLTCPTTNWTGDVNIDGALVVTGWIESETDVKTPLVASQNNHVHVGNLGSPTSVPTG